MKKLFVLILLLCLTLSAFAACSLLDTSVRVVSHEVIGCGGYGAVFNAQIDPFDENCFAASCDMGSLYFSYDKGNSWIRHNNVGTIFTVMFDPATEGVVWAAGSGVYKSTDHGKTVKMVFPNEEQITSIGNNYENANIWIYSDKQSDYAPHYQIWSMAINRKSNGKNVFVAQRIPAAGFSYNQCIRIYQTTDGENFALFAEMEYSYNYKIAYDEANDCLIYITPQKIVEVNSRGEIACEIDQPIAVQFSHGNNMCFDSYYNPQTGKNTFAFSTPVNQEHVQNACYKTQNLRDKSTYEDLTAKICSLTNDDFGVETVEKYNQGRPSYEYCEWINGKTVPQQFKWTVNDVSVLDDNIVYIFHESNTNTYDAEGNFYIKRRVMIYLRYDASTGEFSWVFGNPLKPYNKAIQNYSWQDADSDYCFGMTSSPSNNRALLYCSNVGIYYTEDGKTVTQLNSHMFGEDELTLSNGSATETRKFKRVNTTGMDVICTHSVHTDPFDTNHLLMCCTDIGILQSYDNGKSWYHSLQEWQNGSLKNITYAAYTNTCFDVHFDTQRKDVVYSLWSLEKTAPQANTAAFLNSDARFGISYDGGLSWTMKKITPNGKCVPYKMQVVYEGDQRTIYITTASHGFFVTKDDGETFTAMNDGLERVEVSTGSAIWGTKLLVCEMGTYAITGGTATDSRGQMFYKWNEKINKFEQIGLPQSVASNKKTYTPAAVRDIVYDAKNKCLYLACTANVVTNYNKLEKIAGGVWKYQDGEFTQIYDETISCANVALDGTGRLYVAELDGRLIRFDNNNTTHEVLFDGLFHWLKGLSFSPDNKVIYVSTWGGSVEKLTLSK